MPEIDPKFGEQLAMEIQAPPVPASSTGPAARIRNYFLTGLVVAGPLAVTIWITWSFITWVDGWVRPIIPPMYRPET